MKIAITGDFHFGFNEDAAEQARKVLLDASTKADAVILAGDLFDTRVPRQETIFESVKVFRECIPKPETPAKVFALEGNEKREITTPALLAIYGTHERRTKGLVNVIQLLDSAGIMINCHAKKILVEKQAEDGAMQKVVVQGLGGLPEEMASKAIGLMDFSPVKDAFNIFVFHQSIRELIPQDEECLTMAELPNGFDLYVDGHIHWRQEIKEGGKLLLLAGSTVVTQMKQNETHPKGYYLYDTDKNKATFIVVPTRPFVYAELTFNDSKPAEIEEAIRLKLDEINTAHPGQKPLVKLKLRGKLAEGFTPSQVDIHLVLRDYSEKLMLSIDKELGSLALAERIEQLRKLRQEQPSSLDLGLSLLKKRLKELGVTPQELPLELEDLFQMLSTGEIDAAVDALVAPRKSG